MTSAEWMDGLSDRLGTIIPGGSFLPPRHPWKVSLVMGVLGMTSAVLSGTLLSVSDSFRGATPFFLLSPSVSLGIGLCFGSLVVCPCGLWLDRKFPWSAHGGLFVALSSMLANDAWGFEKISGTRLLTGGYGIPLIIHRCWEDTLTFALATAAVGLALRWRWSLLISATTVAVTVILFPVLNGLLDILFSRNTIEFIISHNATWVMGIWLSDFWTISALHVPAAICLGMQRWDPKPKDSLRR